MAKNPRRMKNPEKLAASRCAHPLPTHTTSLAALPVVVLIKGVHERCTEGEATCLCGGAWERLQLKPGGGVSYKSLEGLLTTASLGWGGWPAARQVKPARLLCTEGRPRRC